MRGEKTITLDYEILYSKGGQFVPTNIITVRAPSLDQYKIHSLMQSWTSEGALGWRKANAETLAKLEAAAEAAQAAPAPQAGAAETPAEDVQIDVMHMMSQGLPPERYAIFSQFVMDTLKNNPRLAYVGGDEKAPITDHVMQQIGEQGGIADWDRIASDFSGFFMLGTGSRQKPSGADSSPTSVSPIKAPSPSPKRANSRLQNLSAGSQN